jgi:hypothetical protein
MYAKEDNPKEPLKTRIEGRGKWDGHNKLRNDYR